MLTKYRIGRMPTTTIGDRTFGGELFRHNDGSLVIMQGHEDDEDTRPVLTVPRVHEVKRSEAYRADDPDQLAFAEKVVRLLNEGPCDEAYEVYWTDREGSPRGAKLNSLPHAMGFIMGLRKDSRNREIVGAFGGQPFNCDEFGEPIGQAKEEA